MATLAVGGGQSLMDPRDNELDDVLRELAGTGMYRNNVFRITGLPTNASTTQIRRRREEGALAAQLGTPPAATSGELPLSPPPDWDVVNAAFESLRNPVLRLVHELLWLWGTENDSDHDCAIRRHCGVLEGQSLIEPGRPDMPNDPLGQQWLVAVNAWANVFSTEEIWDRARQRVNEIDDPRLTTGTVRRLRDRLPRHIVEVNLGLAVTAAEQIGTGSAARYLWVLIESRFDNALIYVAARDAVRPAETRVRAACEAANNVADTTPREAIAAGHTLLEQVLPRLRVAAGLLGPDHSITTAIHDQVARTVNLCAVSHSNLTSNNDPALTLLPTARGLAREQTTIDLIDTNMSVITEQLVTNKVEDLRKAGRVDEAADRLRAWRRRTNSGWFQARIGEVLANPQALCAPLDGAPPFQGAFYGWGMNLWGRRPVGNEGMYVACHSVTMFLIPVIPVAAYLRDDEYIYGKVPLSMAARRWRVTALLLMAFVALQPFRDLPRLLIFLTLLLVTGGALAWLRHRRDVWAAAETEG